MSAIDRSSQEYSPDVSDLSFTATVLNQASIEAPPTIEIALRNDGPEPVEIGYGPALLFSDDVGSTEWAEAIAIEPDHRGATIGPRPQQSGDCWSVSSDADITITSMLNLETLNSGEEVTATVFVYGRSDPDSDQCYPPGEYRFEDQISFYEEFTFEIALEISIGDNGQLSARGEQPYTITEDN
jgi:hypothetical protein